MQNDSKTHEMVMMMGMIGGPMAANRFIETINDHNPAARGKLCIPHPGSLEDHAVFESWGFKWSTDQIPLYNRHTPRNQKLDSEVTVPEGWSIVPTEHYLYKVLLDERGQARASIMMHWQDWDSWIQIKSKYQASYWRANHDEGDPYYPAILDSNGAIMWLGHAIQSQENRHSGQHTTYYRRLLDAGLNHHLAHALAVKSLYQLATANADEIFKEALGDRNRTDQSLFQKPLVFPDWEVQLPVYQEFRLHTEFYSHGSSVPSDSGSSIIKAVDDKAAITKAEARFARGGNVNMRLQKGSEIIWSCRTPLQPASRTRRGRGNVLDTYQRYDHNDF